MNIKKIDLSHIIFILLGSFLIGSFFYSIKIDAASKNNFQTIDKVNNLTLLNQKMDAYLVKRLQYSNLDVISFNVSASKKTLHQLRQQNIHTITHRQVAHYFKEVERKFDDKINVIEDFKSNSGLFITSVRYLLDLNNILQKRYYFSPIVGKSQKIVLIFTQSIFEDNDIYEITRTIQDIEAIQQANKLADQTIKDFILHARLARDYYKELLHLTHQKQLIDLERSLNALKQSLIAYFENSEKEAKILQYSLFMVDAFFLVLLIITLQQKRRQQHELSRFKNAVENSDNTIVITDTNHIITYVNDAFTKTTGFSKEEALGKKPNILKSGRMSPEFYKKINQQLANKLKWEGEFINCKKDGSLYYEAASIVPLMDDEEISGYLAIKLDITDYIEQQKTLLSQTERLNEAQRIAHIGHWEYDVKKQHFTFSEEIHRIIGIPYSSRVYPVNEIIHFIHEDDRESAYHHYKEFIDHDRYHHLEFRIVQPNGKIINVQTRNNKNHNASGEATTISGTLQNITELVRAREKINFMAYHDHLTKLDNRISFENKLEHSILLAKRNHKPLFVFFIDLDRFKTINDTLGHPVGDELLKVIAKRLKEVTREADTLARLGGDEFGLLIETSEHVTDTALVADKILEVVKQPIEFDNYRLDVSASIGIAIYPDNGRTHEALLKNADTAMYLAKEKGKDNYQFFTETLSKETKRRLTIEQALKGAIDNKELSLVYQPQYSLDTKKIVGAEVLLRWNNKALGFVSPAEFIPIAEDSGLITQLGSWVLEHACEDFHYLQTLNLAPKTMSINISSMQFRQKDVVSLFQKAVQDKGITPEQIELEITERYMMESTNKNLNVLHALRKVGFKVSIDDFGTGYSSMTYLKNLPIDAIKIDKSFIDEIPHDKNSTAVTKAIITLAQSLNHTLIAEGIETKEQEYFLEARGCHVGQGYLYSKPLSLNDYIAFATTKASH